MVGTFLNSRPCLNLAVVCSTTWSQHYKWNATLVARRFFIYTFKNSQSYAANSGGKTLGGKCFLPEENNTKVPDTTTVMLTQLHQLSRQNMWQEAFRLFSCNPPIHHQAGKDVVSIESLIAALLFYGHGQSAFSVWSAASTCLNFVPSSLLMLKLAVYTILVNDKGQESMNLPNRVIHENGEETYNAECCKNDGTFSHEECIKLWLRLYDLLLHTSSDKQVENSEFVKASLAAMWHLALLPKVNETRRIFVDPMQYIFHILFSITSTNLISREAFLIGNSAGECLCLFRAVDLLKGREAVTSAVTTAELTDALLPPADTLPFLLRSIFPLSMGCTPENSNKIIVSGLTQYQIFFSGDGKRTSGATVITIGAVWMNELWKRGLDELFLRAVITRDVTSNDTTPLMVQVLSVPSKMLAPTVCSILGQKIFSIVENVLENITQAKEDRRPNVTTSLLVLEYISHVLSPFMGLTNIQERHLFTGVPQHMHSGCIATSSFFYAGLLGSLITRVPQSGVPWDRLIERVTDYLRTHSTHDGQAIPFAWHCQMHRKWWFPKLLATSDAERERQLSVALQRDALSVCESRDQFSSWNSAAVTVLRIFHEQWCNDDVLQWTHSAEKVPQQHVRGCRLNKFQIQRTLVQRFVRWEWLLEGLWEFLHLGVLSARENLRRDLLHACINTLDRCRTFHRRDIAGDLLQILFLPASPFIDPLAVSTSKVSIFTVLTSEFTSDSKTEREVYSTQMPQWQLLNEIIRWLPSLRAWKVMDELQDQFPSALFDSAQRFLTFQYLMNDLSPSRRQRMRQQRVEPCGESERQRIRHIAAHYERACRADVTLRTPQLLVPLIHALRRAGLIDEMTTVLQRTFADVQNGFYAPHRSSVAQRVEDALLFFYGYHEAAVSRMQASLVPCTESQCISSYETAMGMIGAVAETYILSLWESGDYITVERILLKPLHQNTATMSVSVASETIAPEDSKTALFNERDVAFLLPVAEREALRILFVLFIAHRKGASEAIAAIRRLPTRRADSSRTAAYLQRLTKQETVLFASYANMAVLVVTGERHLRDACAIIAEEVTVIRGDRSHHKNESPRRGEQSVETNISPRNIRTMQDLNRCIDRHDWASALEAIPHILTEPLHMTRKALLACEKTLVKGAAWEGAMTIFTNSALIRKQANSRAQLSFGSTNSTNSAVLSPSAKSSRCYAVGLQECGRIMTILADAKRWLEALQVFESLGSFGVDGYIFTQACFALGAGCRPDLAVDLWAMWRAAVGDSVTPTPSMCGQFVRCGVMGNEAIANAACAMVQTASEGVSQTPGAELPLSFEKEENAIVALLQDRWHEGWQGALQVALASGRPRLVESVAWRSPKNHYLYEAVIGQARQEQRALSTTERKAIANHLDLASVLDVKRSCPQADQKKHERCAKGVAEDNAARILRELLGDDV